MKYRGLIAKILLFAITIQILPILNYDTVPIASAIDSDGTADLDLVLTSEVDTSSIVGTTFTLDINLENLNSSEEDAYNPGFVIKIPANVSFTSSLSLGSPTRTEVLPTGEKLLFFVVEGLIPRGTNQDYSVQLSSDIGAELFTDLDIGVLAYAEDNIYGTGLPPSGSPSGTLPGGFDYANSNDDPTNPNFPDNIDDTTDLSSLPFVPSTTQFLPFNIEKIGTSEILIGETGTTTLRVTGNDLGPLSDFEIIDVLPNNRKFVGFTSTMGATTSVAYDTPTPGQVTLTITDIDVPTGGVVDIQYETLALAYEASSYNADGTVNLNTGVKISDLTLSTNTAEQQVAGSWSDGTNTFPVDGSSVIETRTFDSVLSFGDLSKSVDNENPVIGDTIRYTLTYDVAQNMSYNTNGAGTFIRDVLPDGLTFVSEATSINVGTGDALVLTTNTVGVDGETELIWTLPAGNTIDAGDYLTISYDVLVDGLYEGAGDAEYENTQSIINNAFFEGNIGDSGNNEEWGFTDPSLIDTPDTDGTSIAITAPNPTIDKQLVRVKTPDGTVYDATNPIPGGIGIPVDSQLDFVVSMDFPNVFSINAVLKDALPLIAGPNTSTYDIAFQTDATLLDLDGNSVPINDDNADGIADTVFNGQTLGGTTPTDTAWISTSPANNLEFYIASGTGEKTFSLGFSVDILPVKPSGGMTINNILIGTVSDDEGGTNVLGIIKEPFIIGLPEIEVQKTVDPDPTEDIAFGDSVDYRIIIQNSGNTPGYLEMIEDLIPENMTLDTFNMVYGGSAATPVPGASVNQSGDMLEIEFDTQGAFARSFLATDDATTANINESQIILTYTLSPTVDFVIVGEEARENTIAFDYYSSGAAESEDINLIGTAEDSAEFLVASPTVTRTYFSTSEADSPDNQPGGRPDIHAGEEVTFETIITLPGGTYENSEFTESLLTSRLDFVSGTVISTGPNLTFENGTTFSGNSVDFGDIVNTGTTDQTIIIQTTARGKNNTSRRNNNRARGDFEYSGEEIEINTPVDLIIPTLVVTKEANPSIVDTDDIVTYTIDIEHTSASNAIAYDVVLNDILPPNLTYIPGTLAGNANFTGAEADLFNGTGIALDSLAVGATETITFQAEVGIGAKGGEDERNDVEIEYSSLDDDLSKVEGSYSDDSFADITFKNIEITHFITDTSNSDTGTSEFNGSYEDLTIGEELTYNIEIEIPKLIYSGATVTQELPAGFTFLSGAVLTNDVHSNAIETIVINPDNTITFTFGDIDNTGANSGDGFVLETQVLVTDIPDNTAGDTINSIVGITYDDTSSASDNTPNFDIVEPNIVVEKTYSPGEGDGGDSILTTITIENTGTAPLYDIQWTDTLPPKTTGDVDYLANGTLLELQPGDSFTYTYNTILDSSVEFGEILTGDLEATGTSMPLANPDEREYSSDDDATITISDVAGLTKVLTSPNAEVTIGDVVSYQIQVPVLEGVTESIDVSDLIPAGLEVIASSIVVTSDSGVTYTGGTPTVGTQSLGTEQEIDYAFTNISNTNIDNTVVEFITISYDAVVLNTADNNAGDSKQEEVQADYNNGATILDATPVEVEIIEPNVSIDLSSTYTYGNEVTYTYTITNSGTDTAYDLDIDTILPAGLTYDTGFTITNTGSAINLTQVGEDFTITELPVNTGNPLQFTITGFIDATVNDMDDLTVDADLTYTGQDGSYISVTTNTDNTERTGDTTGENDYLDTDPDTITVLLPILDEEISVVDLNGGLGIIGDTFEYTVTLTNSGSVDLTDIEALLDIPEGFTGFTLISTPTGSTDNTDPTGGIDGNGLIDITDIDLLIGQSVTIVYQVTALETVESGTIIPTDVIISDTPEGAVGGNPSIDVEILAPAIQLTKNIGATVFNEPVQMGDIIAYEFIVANTGDVVLYDIVVNDSMLGGDITASCSFPIDGVATLELGESANCGLIDYSLTSSDIIRGYVENSAEVDSVDESKNVVSDVSDTGIGNEDIETADGAGETDEDPTNDPTVQPLVQDPSLKVTKQIVDTNFNIPNLVGDTITYQIILENTGNLNITNVTVVDPLLGGDITALCPFAVDAETGIDVDEIIFCETVEYAIKASDIIRGYVDNNVLVSGTDALGDPVDDISDQGDELTETPSGDGSTDGDPTNDPTTIEIIGEPELTTTKVLSSDTLSTPTASGDTLSYTITIVNTGQLPVSSITLVDSMLGGDITSSCVFPIEGLMTLEVGESATCNPGPYVITENDIAQGYVDNSALAQGLDPNNDPVDDISDPGNESEETEAGDGFTDGDPTNDPTTVPLMQNPAWEIEKTALTIPENVGDVIEYNFAVTNTGNLTIDNPNLSDDKCNGAIVGYLEDDAIPDFLITPGETENFRCFSIPVTQEEMDAGIVNNTVTASGATIIGDLPEITDSHELPVPANPSWILQKIAFNPPLEAGDVLNYEFNVSNTGNVSISNITVSDDKCASSITLIADTDIGSDGILGSGESWVYECTSIPATQAEVDAAVVLNTATVTGTPVRGDLDDVEDTIETPVGPFPAWDIDKTLNTPITQAGDILEYTFVLQNRGNVTISDISVTDDKCSLPPVLDETTDTDGDLKLSPLETWTYTCNSIPVTQAEVDAGEVLNNVVASGTPAQGSLDDAVDGIISEVPANPDWTLDKTTLSAPQFAGDTLEYTFTLSNTGNTTLSEITLSDQKCEGTPIFDATSDTGEDTLLSPNEVWTYNCTSIPVTQAEVDAEEVINIATATATSTRGTLVNATDTNTAIVGLLPKLQLYKHGTFNDENANGTADFGETMSYSFTVRNTGNIDITNITITDALIDISGGPIDLKVGEEDTTSFTGDYLILQPDVIAGYVENSAVVSGESLGGIVTDTSDAGDDINETLDGEGQSDSDPTNDPTVIRFTPSENTTSSSSGGGSSSSSSSGSSGGGGGGGRASTPLPETVPEPEIAPELEAAPEPAAPAPTPVAPEKLTPAQIEEVLISAQEVLRIDAQEQEKLQKFKDEETEPGEGKIEALPVKLPQTGTPIGERVSTKSSPRIETSLPNADIFRLAGDENTDVDHWKQVLPEMDKDAGKYIVVPSNGLVIPINEFAEGSEDFTKMITGREANINEALKTGALEYPGTSTNGYGEVGNKVVFAHSSYWNDDDGRYKTHFQKIIELDTGEQIWVYVKDETGVYQRYIYVTQESYNAPANDTDVLKPGVGKNLTLFTCTPIGGVEGRWVVKAKYLDEAIVEIQSKLMFEDVSQKYRQKIAQIMRSLEALPEEERRDMYLKIYSRILTLLPKYEDSEKLTRVLQFLQLQIARKLISE